MGFLDKIKNVGMAAYDSLQQNTSEVQELKERFEYCSDEELFRGVRRGSYQSRAACSLLLQERGYSQEEVARAMRRN